MIHGSNYYICGGDFGPTSVADCFKLDLAMCQRLWKQIGSMEFPRSNSLLAAYEYEIYALGGGTSKIEILDTRTDTWSTQPTAVMPESLCGTMVVSNGPDIFVIGGVLCSNNATTSSSVYHYDATDPATSPTRMTNDCLIGGSDHYCTVTDALAFGRSIVCVRNTEAVYLPLSKDSGGNWRDWVWLHSAMDGPATRPGLVSLGDEMFILGWSGVKDGVKLNTKKILVFNKQTKQWDEVGPFGPYSFSDGGLFMAVPKHLFPNC